MRTRPYRRLRTALANASLRVRVMAVAALLVMITSVVMGSLGTTLLRGYLLGRANHRNEIASRVPLTTGGGPASLPGGHLGGAHRPPRRRPVDQPVPPPGPRRAWLPVLGPLLLAGFLAAGPAEPVC